MKLKLFISALLLYSIFNYASYAQTKWNLTITGGYTLPVADLKGSFPDTLGTSNLINFEKSGTLLTSGGFNIGAIAKYCVDSTGKARFTGGFNYNSLSGSHDYSRNPGTLTYKNKVNIFTISVGAEYGLFPRKKINPFIGLDLAMNFYSGKIEASGDTTLIIQRKSESRFGVIANVGADIKLNKNLGMVVGVKYALTNLIGKKTELTEVTSPLTDDEEPGSFTSRELGLNDEENSINPSKTLNYIQFYAGISFYFGDLIK